MPPTSTALLVDEDRPYFSWWAGGTVPDLRRGFREPDPKRRVYWMGALLREVNTRDVWFFVTAAEIREHWPFLRRHLGRTQTLWAWLLREFLVEPLPETLVQPSIRDLTRFRNELRARFRKRPVPQKTPERSAKWIGGAREVTRAPIRW